MNPVDTVTPADPREPDWLHDPRILLPLAGLEPGELLETHVRQLHARLNAEILARQAAEERLRKLEHEKRDLEILIQILIDQGDEAAEEGKKARIDGLTQIANRRRFDECLAHEWKLHLRKQEPLSLLICDVDHFKLYNDHYGHQAGDECLKAVAKAISQCIREGALVARYGGEEFAVVLPRTDSAEAAKVAARMAQSLAAAALPHLASPVFGQVTLSTGAASVIPQPDTAADYRILIEEADQNLYLAKRRGRNRIEVSI